MKGERGKGKGERRRIRRQRAEGRGLVKEAEEPEGDFGAKAGFGFIGCDKGIVDAFYLTGSLVFPADFKGEFFIDQKISAVSAANRMTGLSWPPAVCI